MALTLRDVVREYVQSLQDSPEQIVELLMKSRTEQVADLRAYAQAQATQRRARAAQLQADVDAAKATLEAQAAELEAV